MADQVYFEDIEEGQEIPTLRKDPTTQQLVKYAGASGDYYQIHYDLNFAKNNNLPDVILHGALKNAFLGQLVTSWMGDEGTLKKLTVSYRGMDVPGTPVFGKGVIKSKNVTDGENIVECDIWLEDHEGKRNTPGAATVSLPSRGG
ncbi:MAG: MaoC/PaaZ C-terminal domain-containing protein [SAR202 cluster bacterium]|jgi:acyl dehydratase|nr:MaoC/PaaZ C-terminal domain-containing protein [SAR202 cluster bacterium]MDP6512678.1 MaoC/PaaZ C-terminal domain-containing protein [SAR202 cluster bacterium]MDP6715681.1 MaoC/PaaZ C-terminal domain-containing protein [SAR202 cluster bacterium]